LSANTSAGTTSTSMWRPPSGTSMSDMILSTSL
jgi:hypothetical protein